MQLTKHCAVEGIAFVLDEPPNLIKHKTKTGFILCPRNRELRNFGNSVATVIEDHEANFCVMISKLHRTTERQEGATNRLIDLLSR